MIEQAVFLERAVFLALLVEAIIKHVDSFHEFDWTGRIKVSAAIVASTLFCWTVGLNALSLLDGVGAGAVKQIIGIIGTGLVVARGSKVAHDIFSKLDLHRQNEKLHIEYWKKDAAAEADEAKKSS